MSGREGGREGGCKINQKEGQLEKSSAVKGKWRRGKRNNEDVRAKEIEEEKVRSRS